MVEHVADIRVGMFSQPIYGTPPVEPYTKNISYIRILVDGNYPKRVLDTIPASILRRFTDEEKKIIKGSADFFAIGNVLLYGDI